MGLQKQFSASRFNKCLQYDLRLHGKTYLFFAIGLAIVLFAIDFFTLATASQRVDFKESYYIPIFTFLLVISSILSSGTSFPAFRSSNNSINYLLLPASNLEKFLVQFIIRILVLASVFLLLYWLIFKMAYGFYIHFTWKRQLVLPSFGLLSPFDSIKNTSLNFAALALFVLNINLFAFAGSIYFKSYALFKSILISALFIGGILLLIVVCSHLFFSEYTQDFFDAYSVRHDIYGIDNNLLYLIVLQTGVSLFLIPLAYFKLKEKTV